MDKKILQKIEGIAKQFDLKLVILFGSRASEMAGPDSDYDLGVYGGHVLTENEIIKLHGLLAEVFRTDKVDIVDLKKAPPLLKIKAFSRFKVLYETEPFLKYQLPLSAEAEYQECKDLYEIKRQRLKAFVNED